MVRRRACRQALTDSPSTLPTVASGKSSLWVKVAAKDRAAAPPVRRRAIRRVHPVRRRVAAADRLQDLRLVRRHRDRPPVLHLAAVRPDLRAVARPGLPGAARRAA